MPERPENFEAADEDPDVTLVAPRFDANDARRAHPVVPLAEAPARGARARAPRRSWTPALLAVVLLAVAALGGAVATKVLQGPRAERVEEAEQVQQQTQAAPVQTAEAPPQPSTPATAEVPRKARTRRARPATAAAPALEEAEYGEDGGSRDMSAEKRREREDEVEKEMRKALKRAKKNAPRLVDVLTSAP
jgi:hypothetical protein